MTPEALKDQEARILRDIEHTERQLAGYDRSAILLKNNVKQAKEAEVTAEQQVRRATHELEEVRQALRDEEQRLRRLTDLMNGLEENLKNLKQRQVDTKLQLTRA